MDGFTNGSEGASAAGASAVFAVSAGAAVSGLLAGSLVAVEAVAAAAAAGAAAGAALDVEDDDAPVPDVECDPCVPDAVAVSYTHLTLPTILLV